MEESLVRGWGRWESSVWLTRGRRPLRAVWRGASPSGVLLQPPSSSTSGCWAGSGPSPPGHTAPAPPQETRPVWVDVHGLSLPGLRQKSPSCPRTTARPTAAPSGRSSASSCRSSSWAGSTSCASAWYASATPALAGPSRTSTSAGPPTCPSTSSPPAAPSTVPSPVRSEPEPREGPGGGGEGGQGGLRGEGVRNALWT